MSRRTVFSCVLCAFALAPAAFAADVPGDPATGGATAPAAQAPALAPTPAEAVEQAPAVQVPSPQPVAPPPAPPPVPVQVAEPRPQSDSAPVALAAVTPRTVAQAPALRPTSAVIAQAEDDDVVDVPVPRRRRPATPAPPPPAAVQAAPRLPMTGFDLGLFTSAGLVLLGTGVGLSALVGPAPRRRA